MVSRRFLAVLVSSCAAAACSSVNSRRPPQLSPCVLSPVGRALVPTQAEGITLALPTDAKGPLYESDDYSGTRPHWEGEAWKVHFVYGNGGLTEFVSGAQCCALDDAEMHRNVCIGEYMRHGAMADISRVGSSGKVSSMQVTIEPGVLTEAEALSMVGSAITSWEKH
jgi:hypothetical protein